MHQKSCSKGNYYILNRQELLRFLIEKRRINTILCNRCKKDECYSCNRFNYIRNQLEKNAFFEKQDWPRQPVLWQVFHDFNKKTNNLDKSTVLSNFLVKKYDFENDKIIEIFEQ